MPKLRPTKQDSLSTAAGVCILRVCRATTFHRKAEGFAKNPILQVVLLITWKLHCFHTNYGPCWNKPPLSFNIRLIVTFDPTFRTNYFTFITLLFREHFTMQIAPKKAIDKNYFLMLFFLDSDDARNLGRIARGAGLTWMRLAQVASAGNVVPPVSPLVVLAVEFRT